MKHMHLRRLLLVDHCILLLLLCILPLVSSQGGGAESCQWIPLGTDVRGTGRTSDSGAPENFGASLALSGDGSTFAASGLFDVRVFRYSAGWRQIGDNIPMEGGNGMDSLISLSHLGTRIVIWNPEDDTLAPNAGAARVYAYDGADWNQVGQDLVGPQETNAGFGGSVALSGDGTLVVVGSPQSSSLDRATLSGAIYTWRLAGTAWVPVGSILRGIQGEQMGSSLDLSRDGKTLVVGAPAFQGQSGRISVYRLSDTDEWIQTGDALLGSNYFDANRSFGKSVACSSDGSTVAAVGDSGMVAFRYTGLIWAPIAITNLSPLATVDLSSNGNIVAFGSGRGGNTTNGIGSGFVQAFLRDEAAQSWVEVGSGIPGFEAGDEAGGAMAISDTGAILAVGARNHNFPVPSAGHVQVYTLADPSCIALASSPPNSAPSLPPTPTTPPPVATPPGPSCAGYNAPCTSSSSCCSNRCSLNVCQKAIDNVKMSLSNGRGGAAGRAKEGTRRIQKQQRSSIRGNNE